MGFELTMNTDLLISELDRLGLHYLVGESVVTNTEPLKPESLLAGLSAHPDARVRHALIALLLFKPVFSDFALKATGLLTGKEKTRFMFYYTAGMLLQQIYISSLKHFVSDWKSIPDLFSSELGLPGSGTPSWRMQKLSELQNKKSRLSVDWPGTYNNIAERLIARCEKEHMWPA